MEPSFNILLTLSGVLIVAICANAGVNIFGNHHSHHATETRIIDGQPAKPHSFPSIVALTAYDPSTKNYSACGGTLISDSHILTAAHCVYGKEVYALQFGAHNRSKVETDQTVIFGQGNVKYITHSLYNARRNRHDIAIIKLLKPLDVNNIKYVDIAKLPEDKAANETYVNSTVTSYGWGLINDNPEEDAKELMNVNLTVIDLPTCYNELQKASYPYYTFLYFYEICTSGHGPHGSIGDCHGDSGGPLVYNGTVIGVVSRSATGNCTQEEPTVFVSVGQHLNWIKDKLKNF